MGERSPFDVVDAEDPAIAAELMKSSHRAVHYHPAKDSSDQCCKTCAMFVPSEYHAAPSCTSVRSVIFESWLCDLYEPDAEPAEPEVDAAP
jgi:hypothetical protein